MSTTGIFTKKNFQLMDIERCYIELFQKVPQFLRFSIYRFFLVFVYLLEHHKNYLIMPLQILKHLDFKFFPF